ncbi:MAG TPA: helix-turn-helix domain-containing protein [Anaerolineales bacterium]|nr:helix-turn-helix domain-containing protein [Anaerolineales bacterium]
MESVQKQLEELGLSPNEVRVYLASLELGAATVLQLAAKSAVVRPTAHVAVGGLVKRGLMSSHTRGKKQYYQAERPGRLLRIIEEEKKKIFARESKLLSVLPGLESLIMLSKERPEVKYYEGFEGLEALREILLHSKAKEFVSICNQKALKQVVSEPSVVVHSYKIIKSGISGKQIILYSKNDRVSFTQKSSNIKHKLKLVKDNSNLAEITIFENNVALLAYLDKPIGFLLKSKDIAGVARQLFDLAWGSDELKPFRE